MGFYDDRPTYVISLNGEEWEYDTFINMLDANRAVRELMNEQEEEYEYAYVGEKEDYLPVIDAEKVIERLSEDSYNDSPDYGDNYLVDLPPQDIILLQKYLDDALNKWIDKTGNKPNHYNVNNKYRVYKR